MNIHKPMGVNLFIPLLPKSKITLHLLLKLIILKSINLSRLHLLLCYLLLRSQVVKNILNYRLFNSKHFKHVVLRQTTQTHTFTQNRLLYYRVLRIRQTQAMRQLLLLTTQQQHSSLTLLSCRILTHSPRLALNKSITTLSLPKN